MVYLSEADSEMGKKNIPLIECIPTWQGEGPNAGKRMLLVRFKFCNRTCIFCDTQTKMNVPEVMYSLNELNNEIEFFRNLMITGGEPTLKTGSVNNYQHTVDMLRYCNYDFADVETNGFNLVEFLYVIHEIENLKGNKKTINVSWSPKFASVEDLKYNIDIFNDIQSGLTYGNTEIHILKVPTLKLVISDDIAIKFLDEVISMGYDTNRIYLMPLGSTLDKIQKSFPDIVKLAEQYNCHISSRMHLVHNFA